MMFLSNLIGSGRDDITKSYYTSGYTSDTWFEIDYSNLPLKCDAYSAILCCDFKKDDYIYEMGEFRIDEETDETYFYGFVTREKYHLSQLVCYRKLYIPEEFLNGYKNKVKKSNEV